ncbi:HD family hydrolase [Luedemannella flava]
MGILKRMRRAGWWHAGIRDPESVAEHSLRVSQLAALTGDLPHTARPYVTAPDPLTITADQTARLPDAAARTVREAVAEYEARTTVEAQCAYDADKLECLLQAVEYKAAGNAHVQGWIDSSRRALKTRTAGRIADAALTISPLAWRDR